FSRDGRALVEVTERGVARWQASDLARGQATRTAFFEAQPPFTGSWGAMLLPGGEKLFYSRAAEIGVAEVGSASLVERRLGAGGPAYVSVSRDGKQALVAPQMSGGNLAIWDLERGVETGRLLGTTQRRTIELAPGGGRAVTGSGSEGPVVVWDVATGAPVTKLEGYMYARFAPDGRSVL